jgi:hypothetical protein
MTWFVDSRDREAYRQILFFFYFFHYESEYKTSFSASDDSKSRPLTHCRRGHFKI